MGIRVLTLRDSDMRRPWQWLLPRDRNEAKRARVRAQRESRQVDRLHESAQDMSIELRSERSRNNFAALIAKAYEVRTNRDDR